MAAVTLTSDGLAEASTFGQDASNHNLGHRARVNSQRHATDGGTFPQIAADAMAEVDFLLQATGTLQRVVGAAPRADVAGVGRSGDLQSLGQAQHFGQAQNFGQA